MLQLFQIMIRVSLEIYIISTQKFFIMEFQKKRLNISKKKIYEKNYLIFSGNYFFKPNEIAIKNILKILQKFIN